MNKKNKGIKYVSLATLCAFGANSALADIDLGVFKTDGAGKFTQRFDKKSKANAKTRADEVEALSSEADKELKRISELKTVDERKVAAEKLVKDLISINDKLANTSYFGASDKDGTSKANITKLISNASTKYNEVSAEVANAAKEKVDAAEKEHLAKLAEEKRIEDERLASEKVGEISSDEAAIFSLSYNENDVQLTSEELPRDCRDRLKSSLVENKSTSSKPSKGQKKRTWFGDDSVVDDSTDAGKSDIKSYSLKITFKSDNLYSSLEDCKTKSTQSKAEYKFKKFLRGNNELATVSLSADATKSAESPALESFKEMDAGVQSKLDCPSCTVNPGELNAAQAELSRMSPSKMVKALKNKVNILSYESERKALTKEIAATQSLKDLREMQRDLANLIRAIDEDSRLSDADRKRLLDSTLALLASIQLRAKEIMPNPAVPGAGAFYADIIAANLRVQSDFAPDAAAAKLLRQQASEYSKFGKERFKILMTTDIGNPEIKEYERNIAAQMQAATQQAMMVCGMPLNMVQTYGQQLPPIRQMQCQMAMQNVKAVEDRKNELLAVVGLPTTNSNQNGQANNAQGMTNFGSIQVTSPGFTQLVPQGNGAMVPGANGVTNSVTTGAAANSGNQYQYDMFGATGGVNAANSGFSYQI